MRFPILARHTFTCALGLLLGPYWVCLGEDCNQNGRPDDQDLAPEHIAFGALEELEVVETGDTPWSSAVGDFDGDGSMDVVVASDKGRVHLVLNKGAGTFDKPVVIANGLFPSDTTALDVDQDGATDIAYWDGGEPAIIILLNLGGVFTDPEKHIVPIQYPVYHFVAADLDGDDAPELLVAGGFSEGELVILRNDGGGLFESKEYMVAGDPRRPLVEDLDGDGYADILIVSDQDRSSQFLKNQGDATLAPARPIALEPSGAYPTLAADFDGDQDIDLSDGRHVFRNNGQGNFGAGELINVELSMRSPLAQDVDGDKDPDLFGFAKTGDGLVVSLNSGNATLMPPLHYRQSQHYSPRALADFNLDGHLDCLFMDSSCGKGGVLSRLPGLFPQSQDVDGNGVPDECQPDINRNGVPDSHEIATGQSPDCNRNGVPDPWEVAKGFDFEEGWKAADLLEFSYPLSADLNGDSYPDLILLTQEWIDPGINIVDPEPTESCGVRGGLPDVAFINTQRAIIILFNDNAGDFGRRVKLEAPKHLSRIALGDIDGDADIDLISSDFASKTLLLFLNSGDGSFEAGASYPLAHRPSWVGVPDVDADGNVDIVVSHHRCTEALPGVGDGTFEAARPLFTGVGSVAIDLDGDDRVDFIDNVNGDEVNLWVNEGDFSFVGPYKAGVGYVLATGDLDGDGATDLVMGSSTCRRRFGLFRRGVGFEELEVFPELGLWNFAVTGDFESDGDLDLVVNGSEGLDVFENDGLGWFASPLTFSIGSDSAYSFVPWIVEDFDGDGSVDIFASVFGGSEGVVLRNNTSSLNIDLDNDGIPDECSISGLLLVGDSNQDAVLNISDPVWLLQHLFQGAGTTLACSGGTAASPSRADLELLDVNDDNVLNLTDAVGVVRFLFLGDLASQRLGNGCQPIGECPGACGER